MKNLPKHQLRLLAEVIVFKLYEAHLDDEMRDHHSLEDIHKMFSVPVSRKLIDSCLTYLRAEHFSKCIVRSGVRGSYFFKISSNGILFAEQELKKKGSLMSYYSSNGDESLEAVAGFDAIFRIGDEEAQESQWLPLEIDQQSAAYTDFVLSLEISIKTIEESNELSAEFPDQKEEIIEALKEGRDKIASGSINSNKIQRYFVDPLKWISSTFAKSALSAAANATIQKLAVLISSLL